MTEKTPEQRSIAAEALRESQREKIRERILWCKQNDPDGNDVRQLVAVLVEEGYEFSEDNDIIDHIIDDNTFAKRVAEMLSVPAKKLIATEFISKEDFLDEED